MQNLFTGIYNRFQSTSASSFYNALSGKMYLGEAPTTASYPYAVYNLVIGTHDANWQTNYEEAVIDFAMYSDSTSGATEIVQLYSKLKEGYDEANFTVTGNSLVRFRRESAWLNKVPLEEPNKSVWQYVVQYRALMREST